MSKIFISFKTQDKDQILPIYNSLKSKGIDVFMSSEDISFGEDWAARIVNELAQSAFVLAFISDAYISDCHQVERELALADNNKKEIYPIFYKTRVEQIPDRWKYLTGRQGLPIDDINKDVVETIANYCQRFIEYGHVLIASPEESKKEADALLKDHKWDEALKIYENIVNKCPEVYPRVIDCKIRLGQFQSSRESAREALSYYPITADTYFYSAMANLAGREEYTTKILERSTELLEKAWRIKPDIIHCYLAYCIAYLFKKRSFSIPQSICAMLSGNKIEPTRFLSEFMSLLKII